MERKSGKRRRWPATAYPFVFSLIPALSLYLHNIREVAWTQALWASAVSLAIAVACWFATRMAASGAGKRALILFLSLLLFHFYGMYHEAISGLLPSGLSPLAAHALAFIFPGSAWLVLIVLLRRSRRAFLALGIPMGLAMASWLAWIAAGIIIHHARLAASNAGSREAVAVPAHSPAQKTPDIYCFMLDEFTAPEAVRRLYGLDNSRFVSSLRDLGFFVAEQSVSRYARTEPVLAGILNLGAYSAKDDPYPLIRDNAVVSFLKGKGYRIIEFASIRELFLAAADQRFFYDLSKASLFFDDYYRILFERTLLRILPDMWRLKQTDLSRYYRQRILEVFARLPEVLAQAGPKFVYVHLLSPHEPFVFMADGAPAPPGHFWDHSTPRHYLEQYRYISERIVDTVRSILSGSADPPVILLFSDHSYRGSRKPDSIVPREEMRRVLNALYLPGVPQPALDPALSTRNNFRLVFNLYFGADYPLLAND